MKGKEDVVYYQPKTPKITGYPPHPKRGLTVHQVAAIRSKRDEEPFQKYAHMYGVSAVTVYNCYHRLTYKELP